MAEKDAKIIFMNVAEIAMFSDMFTERLEEALGAVLEGGTGEDHVGALFLEMVRTMHDVHWRVKPVCLNLLTHARFRNWSRCTGRTSRDIRPLWNT